MFSKPQYSNPEPQKYNCFILKQPAVEPVEKAIVCTQVYEENGVLYCTSRTSERGYYYTYALNNPLKFIDPDGYRAQPKELWENIRNYNFDFPFGDWIEPYKVNYYGGGGPTQRIHLPSAHITFPCYKLDQFSICTYICTIICTIKKL